MDCPDCGGPMWDNRQTKKNPKQPDFKCKDKDGCGKGVWVKAKGNDAPGARGPASGAARRPLGPLYYDCLKLAKACVEKELKGALPADVIAAAATLFIAASRDGTPLTAPKPKPAPPPEPEPEYEDYPDEEGLPF